MTIIVRYFRPKVPGLEARGFGSAPEHRYNAAMSTTATVGTSDPGGSVGRVRVDDLIPQPHGGALRPPWGSPGRPAPAGRVQGAASIVQWCRVFIVEPKYGGPLGMLKIAKRARHGKTQAEQIAARRVLRARRMKSSRSGRPLAHDDLEGLLDRDLGKPTQSLQIDARVETVEECESDLLAILRGRPDLLPSICERIVGQIPGMRSAILERLSPAVAALPAPEG